MADLSFITWIQGFSTPVLDGFFRWITLLGDQEYYMVVIPLLYWLWSKEFGIRFTLVFMISIYLNAAIKYNYATERPDMAVRLIEEDGFSFPSGHAQGNTVFWGYLARELHRRWSYVAAAVLVFLVAFSRVYLGVHFPLDIIGGVLVGLIILSVFEFVQQRYNTEMTDRTYYLLTGGVVVLLFLVQSFGLAPIVLGFGLAALWGYRLEKRTVDFEERAAWWQQVIKGVLGLVVLFGLREVTRTVFIGMPGVAEEQELLYAILTFFRYFVIGIWVTLAAPWLFKMLRLYRQA